MRLHRWIVTIASRLVPRASRREWRQEWDAELRHREAAGAQWAGRARGHRLELLRQSTGAIWDALWLQSHRWYSLRLFGRHWRLAASAVLSLAIAVAAVTIGLSAYNVLMLRPPNVPAPRSLRLIHISTSENPYEAASFPEFTTYRTTTRAFSDIAAFPNWIATQSLTAAGRTEQIVATRVSDNFFRVLGIKPRVGSLTLRTAPADDVSDVVISERLWRSLGSDPGIVGTTIRLDDQPVTVAGVASTFGGMTWYFEPDVWMSFRASERVGNIPGTEITDRAQRWLHMVGRLRPGVSDAQAATDVSAIAAAVARDYPAVSRNHSAIITAVTVTPPEDRRWAAVVGGTLLLIVVLTLIVAGANVVNLLLGLAALRRHEMLVRAALGASRIQIIVPIVREAVLLVLTSTCIGYGAAWALLVKLSTAKPSLGSFLPSLTLDLRPDGLVLALMIGIALVTGLLIGLPPALRAASDGLAGAINREKAIDDPRKSRVRGVLILIQVAVTTMVLATIGASLHSLFSLRHLPLGFTARHLIYTGVDLRKSGYDATHAPAFMEKMRERVAALPGVNDVTLASDPPLSGYSTDHMTLDGARATDAHGTEMPYIVVDQEYFSTIGLSLLKGRMFDSRDRVGGAEVALVNRTFAERYFGGKDPIGHSMRLESNGHLVEFIGIVADGKYNDIDEDPVPMVYLPLAQRDVPIVTVIANSGGASDSVLRALEEMEPRLVGGGVGAITLDDVLRISMMVPLIVAWTAIAFGIIAIGMSVFGLYSTVFYAISQRRTEIGIRTTLGASPRDLFGMILRQTGRLAAWGALGGLVLGFALMPVVAAAFFGVAPVEPLAMIGAASGAAAIVIVTTYTVVKPWTRLAAMDLLRP
jgi:predicted permease